MEIGLTGSVGAGKSTVAKIFQDFGVHTVDADDLARKALEMPESISAIREKFGNEFVEGDSPDRAAIADLVFNNPDQLQILNAIIHPLVRQQYEMIKNSLNDREILLYDVPLLFETNMADRFDFTITVSADDEIRRNRSCSRSGWSENEFHRRNKAQLPQSEKEKLADYIIHNNGNQDQLKTKVKEILHEIKETEFQS